VKSNCNRSATPEKRPEAIDHAGFLAMLAAEFPEVPETFGEYGKGLLHSEMGSFAKLAERAMDQGHFWQAEKYFRFVERVRERATPEVENAIDVSFLEYFAFSEITDERYQAMKRMPKMLRDILMEIDGRGRWV
jgi:hypothetical protein